MEQVEIYARITWEGGLGVHRGELHEGQKREAWMQQPLHGFCVSPLHVRPVSSQVARSSPPRQGTAAVVETAAAVLLCVCVLTLFKKKKKKEKRERLFHFFRPGSSGFLQLFLSSGQLGFPPPARREVTPSTQSEKAGGGLGEMDVQGAGLDFQAPQT